MKKQSFFSPEQQWFSSLKNELETAYLQHAEPWKQSGFSGPEERWVAYRKPIADAIEKSGTFLDIGCANGYLLEGILKWTAERGLNVIPYGLDLSEKLAGLARQRLPEYQDNIFVGNGWTWQNPVRFDYVRAEIVYVPEELRQKYLERIFNKYLVDNGALLLAEYRSSKTPAGEPWLNETLVNWGFKISRQLSGIYNNKELTRVWVIKKNNR